MADKFDVGPKIGIEGEAELKKAVAQINTNLKTLDSEMRMVASSFDKGASSQEALTAKNKVLTKQIAEQSDKLEQLKAGLASSTEKYGENSAETQRWQQQVNNATATLNNMQRELKDNEGAIKGLNDAAKSERMEKFSASLKAVGDVAGKAVVVGLKTAGAAMAAVGAAAIAAATAIWNIGKKSGDAADELLTLSAQTGISVGTLQELQYAARFVDVEVGTLTKGLAKTTKATGEAVKSNKDYIDVADGVKVSIRDANGEIKSSEQIFYDSVDALAGIKDETLRNIAAQDMFGKSYQDLMPLINSGTGALALYAEEARKMGLVLSDEMVAKLGQFDDIMERTEAQFDGIGKQLAVTFLPALQSVGTGISEFLSVMSTALSDGIQASDIKTIGTWLSTKIIEGLKSISKYIPEVVSVLSGMLTEAINVIVALLPEMLPVLMQGAMQLIQGLLTAISANAEPLAAMVVQLITMFVTFLTENLPMVISTATQIIIAIVMGLTQAMPQLIPAAIDAITAIVTGLIDNVDLLIPAALEMIVAIVTGIIQNVPKLLEAAWKIVKAIGEGIWNALVSLDDAIEGIINAVVDGIAGFATDIWEAGKNIVKGIWDGIVSMAEWLWDKVTGFFNGIVNGIKDILGIKSPSTVFAGIGENMAAGIGVGFGAEMKKVSKIINGSIPTDGVSIGVNGLSGLSGRSVSRGSVTINVYPRDLSEGQTDYLIKRVNRELGAMYV
ncbi:MAG: hypothetical protein AAGU74_13985 [Bacillota bacterium]